MRIVRVLGFAAVGCGIGIALSGAPVAGIGEPPYTDSFLLNGCTFRSTGSTPYWVLEPGFRLVLEGDDDGEHAVVEITVLEETETILGRETRVVEEREWKDGELVEVSRNFLAICEENCGVFYAGEDVDIYEDGEIVSHDGAWRGGVDGARGGLLFPGLPLLGARYYQEIAPGVALDRAEIVGVAETLDTPAGRFTRCVRTRETTPLEPGAEDFKVYAPGIGLVKDGPLLLSSYGFD